jgi:superfamily II DNA helicase RecQ
MKYKFFAIPARNPEVDEAALNSFCSQHRVTFIEKQLVADGAQSFWSVCVTYRNNEEVGSDSKDQRKPRIDYKKVLNEADFNHYLELHTLRKEMAAQQGVPTYAIFTNEHLATMVQQRINTKTALETIDNVGAKRVEQYGDEFLKRLKTFWASDILEAADETTQHNT